MKIVKIKNLILAGLVVSTMSSCYSVTTCVGNVKVDDPAVKVNTVKNHHFIYGLVNGGNTKLEDTKYVGTRKNYKVKKSTTFVDGLLEAITFGLYTRTTTTYYLPVDQLCK